MVKRRKRVLMFSDLSCERQNRIMKIVKLYKGGATILEIVKNLNMTQSTVCADIAVARQSGIDCPRRSPARANTMTGQNIMAGVVSRRKAAQAAIENEYKPRQELPECVNPVRFMDLKPNCCKWPAVLDYTKTNSDSLFCGERVATSGEPWCEAHRAVAWVGKQGMSEGLRGQRMDKTVKRCEAY